MGVATGCGFKEIYRFTHTTYPYSSCICTFLQQYIIYIIIIAYAITIKYSIIITIMIHKTYSYIFWGKNFAICTEYTNNFIVIKNIMSLCT